VTSARPPNAKVKAAPSAPPYGHCRACTSCSKPPASKIHSKRKRPRSKYEEGRDHCTKAETRGSSRGYGATRPRHLGNAEKVRGALISSRPKSQPGLPGDRSSSKEQTPARSQWLTPPVRGVSVSLPRFSPKGLPESNAGVTQCRAWIVTKSRKGTRQSRMGDVAWQALPSGRGDEKRAGKG
jgi:hypothetical protein